MSSDVRKPIDPGAPYGRTLKYSIDEKLAIISHAKNHGNRAAGREFNVAESSIREWRKNENKLIYNKHHSAAGLSATSPPSVHPSLAAGSANLNNNNNINNNNNNNISSFNKSGSFQQSQALHRRFITGGIFGVGNENNEVNQLRNQENLMKIQLVQLAMLNMDFTHLAQLGPFLQLQHQRQLQASSSGHPNVSLSQPLPELTSTSSSVAGTPSSISSSSTPPRSLSPIASGSGRRKPKCPQKIVTTS